MKFMDRYLDDPTYFIEKIQVETPKTPTTEAIDQYKILNFLISYRKIDGRTYDSDV